MFEQREFQPQLSKTIGAANYKAADYTKGFNERDAWLRKGESEFLASLRRNADIAAENAYTATRNNDGKGLQAIGQLAGPLMELSGTLKAREEQKQKDAEAEAKINAEMNALMGGAGSMVEGDQQIEQMGQLADAESQVVFDYQERTGDQTGASYMHTAMGERTGTQAMLSGQMSVRQARGMFPAWLQQYTESGRKITINGQETTVGAAIQSGDPASIQVALNAAPAAFLRESGLYGSGSPAARAEIVNGLSSTIWGTLGNTQKSLLGNAAKAVREQNQSQATGQAFSSATAGAISPGQVFREGADFMFRSNTGLSRTESNEKVVDAMLSGYIASGDLDAIEEMNMIQQVPGQRGTELGLVYGEKISEALLKAKQRERQNDSFELEAAKEAMYADLKGVNDPGERTKIMERYASDLDATGQYEAAYELRGTVKNNMTSGAQAVNAALIEAKIPYGKVTSEQIQQALDEGSITQADATSLMKELAPVDMTKNNSFKDVFKPEFDGAELEFMQAVGVKKDSTGNYLPGESGVISAGAAKAIAGRMRIDMERAVSLGVARSGASTPGDIVNKTTELSKEWIKLNLHTEGGKYYLGGDTLDTEGRKQLKERFKELNTTEGLNSAYAIPLSYLKNSTAEDYSDSYYLGNPVPAELKQNYNGARGDKLVSKVRAEYLGEQLQSGKIPQSLIDTANGLGVAPRKLIEQQLNAHGLPPLPLDLIDVNASGTTQLMQSGMPAKNASHMMKITDEQDKALDIIGKYEAGNFGYEAFNQGGYAGGRGAIGSGSYQQRFGRSLTSMSIGELQALQAPRPGMSQAEWNRQGRLHAIGKYQFTRDTFIEYSQKLGLDPNTLFTPEVQDQMALALMKDRGISPWIGPMDKASSSERAVISQATQQLRTRQMAKAEQILNNPYSTRRQVSRTHAFLQNSYTGPQLQAASTIPYVNQRTAINGAGDRQCFSATSTMLAGGYGVNVSYDKFNQIRARYGDTTDPNAQVAALRELGINASVDDTGSLNEVSQLVSTGRPVAIGIQHNAGSGHWIVVTGVTPQGDFIVNDPFGKLVQRRGGGWAYTNQNNNQAGRNVVYGRDFLYSIFEDRGAGTGRIMRVT